MMQYKKIIFIVINLIIISDTYARFNWLNPHDPLIRPVYTTDTRYQLSVVPEIGFMDVKGFNRHGNKVNILHLFEPQQNALAMLNGFDPASTIGQLRTLINASDDGTRGHINICGDIDLTYALAFGGWFRCTDNFSVNTYLTYYDMKLHNVQLVDSTPNTTPQDQRVKALLTNNIAQNLLDLGCLDISGWSRSGIGDWRTDIIWCKDFVQMKPFLKNVTIEWRVGLSLPTGKRKDEDKLLAESFGYDGSVGVPFGMGIQLQLGAYVKTGLDIELVHIFGNTRYRRIKTSEDQSELFILQKTSVHKDYGLNQRFNLYVGFYNLYDLFSCTFGYQFFKHGDDEYVVKSNNFSYAIANSARILDEYTMHHVIINATYDMTHHFGEQNTFHPHASLFVRLPFNGKNSGLSHIIGGSISCNF